MGYGLLFYLYFPEAGSWCVVPHISEVSSYNDRDQNIWGFYDDDDFDGYCHLRCDTV